jgi:transposase
MQLHDAIGIDPDSRGCVACLVKRTGEPKTVRTFPLTNRGREALAIFIASVPGVLVGIEGRRGQSSPLESFFEERSIPYHTVPALNISSYRSAMVGQQKNNRDDARSVAEFLLDIEAKGRLDEYARHDKPDEDLRILARERQRLGQEMTVFENRLWKLLMDCAHDLYLVLNGSGDEETGKTSMASRRLLRLFVALPDISRWSALNDDELCELSGGKRATGWENFASTVRTPLNLHKPIGFGHQLIIKNTAETLLQMIEQKAQLDGALESAINDRPLVKALRNHYVGMGSYTAALIAEEIITIDRFKNDDRLASYAGLTKRSYSTGSNLNQRKSSSCNKRLKSAFITFAKGYLRCNKDSHLARYHQHLLQTGMSRMEALKRIARSLAREVHRNLKQMTVENEGGKSVA